MMYDSRRSVRIVHDRVGRVSRRFNVAIAALVVLGVLFSVLSPSRSVEAQTVEHWTPDHDTRSNHSVQAGISEVVKIQDGVICQYRWSLLSGSGAADIEFGLVGYRGPASSTDSLFQETWRYREDWAEAENVSRNLFCRLAAGVPRLVNYGGHFGGSNYASGT